VRTGPDGRTDGAADVAVGGKVQSERLKLNNDPRITNLRTWNDGNNFKPYADKDAWIRRTAAVRQQILLAAGLWPLPARCPLNAVIHSPIYRPEYTVHKVFFQSLRGFYVTGNLYQPRTTLPSMPGVLCPHGHWPDGRFLDVSAAKIDQQIEEGFEIDRNAARSPLQARCVQLARMGCVVFHYDMVGYGDSRPEPHRGILIDAETQLYGLSVFGLQTWNSHRAMDFLLSVPGVDPQRIACTGSSGGGTQTFILMATDDRLTAAAPVCMLSAGEHQGGCRCENAPLLRLFSDNIEFASTFAPRPLFHVSATGDWTGRFMKEGFPQIQATYRLFNAEGRFEATCFAASHNYNLKSRLAVYEFLNRHLCLDQPTPIQERPYTPIEPADLRVFDAGHSRPADDLDAEGLKAMLIADARKQFDELIPHNRATMERFRKVVGSALRLMTASGLAASEPPVLAETGSETIPAGGCGDGTIAVTRLLIVRSAAFLHHGETPVPIPARLFTPQKADGNITIIVRPEGKSGLEVADGTCGDLFKILLKRGQRVLAPDVFLTGELCPQTLPQPHPATDFVWGYNRTPLANRVDDILKAVACARELAETHQVNLIGVGRAGIWCLLARALAGDAIAATVIDANRFDFDAITSENDVDYLPSALRYGGLWGLGALCAPNRLLVINVRDGQLPRHLAAGYAALGAQSNLRLPASATAEEVAKWILET